MPIYASSIVALLWRLPANATLYEVYLDGVLQGTATGGSYLQTDLRDGIDYAYEVLARYGNRNALVSAQLTVNTADRPMPTRELRFELGLTSRIYAADSATKGITPADSSTVFPARFEID